MVDFDVLGGQWDHCSSSKLPFLAAFFVFLGCGSGEDVRGNTRCKSLAGNCSQMPSLERQDF